MTYAQAFEAWKESIRPAVVEAYGADDRPALAESWNDYTDALCKDGELTDLQYQHCPAFDDSIPDDDDAERAYILGALGVVLEIGQRASRPDGDDWTPGARHFEFVVGRGSRTHKGFFTQGSALTNKPDVCDILAALLMDTGDVDQPFDDWAESLGYDTDSRKAEATYNECKAELAALERMFTDQELEDLRELFSDY